jgi:hypothetical protein
MLTKHEWKKSSHCESSGCVETARTSPVDNNACVEVLFRNGHYYIRQSDAPMVMLKFTPAEWEAFVAGAKDGEFDI